MQKKWAWPVGDGMLGKGDAAAGGGAGGLPGRRGQRLGRARRRRPGPPAQAGGGGAEPGAVPGAGTPARAPAAGAGHAGAVRPELSGDRDGHGAGSGDGQVPDRPGPAGPAKNSVGGRELF